MQSKLTMSITIRPPLEDEIRARAEAEGISVEAYLQRLMSAERNAADELERLAIEGLHSGDPIEPNGDYWKEKHSKLDERLNKARLP